MRTLAGWCVRHRRLVVLLWIAVLVVSIFAVKSVGTAYSDNFNFPHTQSFDAINLLKSVAPAHSGDTEQVVFGTAEGRSLTDPAVGQRINTMAHKIAALPNVSAVQSPYDSSGNLVNTANINHDKTVGWFEVDFDKTQNESDQCRGEDVRRHGDAHARATDSRWPSPARWPRTPTIPPSAARCSASSWP